MFGLLRYFSMASAIALMVVASALAYFYPDNAVGKTVVSAAGANAAPARPIADILGPRISRSVMMVSGTAGDRMRPWPETARIDGAETARIDGAVRTLTSSLAVLKIKVHNFRGLRVYSSEPGRIGEHKCKISGFPHSPRKAVPAREPSFGEPFSAFSGADSNRGLAESH